MITWTYHRKKVTESTNLDARAGAPFDVFFADYQTAGRGRLDHKWESERGKNLIMSVVLPAGALKIEDAATLPLVAGLSVAKAIALLENGNHVTLKWPNDIYVEGEKVAGILCERHGDNVIVGIGVNLDQPGYRSVRLRDPKLSSSIAVKPKMAASGILAHLELYFEDLCEKGFGFLHPVIAEIDFLKGRTVSVIQTDDDPKPITGPCEGILEDGSLSVGGVKVYAGEAHVTAF